MAGVATRGCVLVSNLSELFAREASAEPNERRPKPPMNQRDLAADKSAHENLIRTGNRPEDRIDVMTLWMGPPAALDVFADDSFRETRGGTFGRSQDDAVFSDESQRFLRRGALRHDAQRDRRGSVCGLAALLIETEDIRCMMRELHSV